MLYALTDEEIAIIEGVKVSKMKNKVLNAMGMPIVQYAFQQATDTFGGTHAQGIVYPTNAKIF